MANLFSSISNTVNSFKKKIVLNENYLTNEFSVSTDRGTSLGLIYVGKLEYVP